MLELRFRGGHFGGTFWSVCHRRANRGDSPIMEALREIDSIPVRLTRRGMFCDLHPALQVMERNRKE